MVQSIQPFLATYVYLLGVIMAIFVYQERTEGVGIWLASEDFAIECAKIHLDHVEKHDDYPETIFFYGTLDQPGGINIDHIELVEI